MSGTIRTPALGGGRRWGQQSAEAQAVLCSYQAICCPVTTCYIHPHPSCYRTINTIATKLQDRVVVGHDEAGLALNFKHPAVQTSMMFAGEALLLIPYLLRRWWKAEERAQRPQEEKDLADVRLRKTFWLFAIPAMFDACGTTLLNLGLYYTCACG